MQQSQRSITRFRTQKTASLLAYFAYYRHQWHPREVLIEMLWPEVEPSVGRHRLSMALSSLRHQLEPLGVPAGAVVQADRFRVRLNPDAVTTDVAEFEDALRQLSTAERGEQVLLSLESAVALYGGPLLPGFYEDWIVREQERLSEVYWQAIRRLVDELEDTGDWQQAIAYARRAVSAAPLREAAHQELIRLLAEDGQSAAARRQVEELERLLQQELGETPSEATRALVEQIGRARQKGHGHRQRNRPSLVVPSQPAPRNTRTPELPNTRLPLQFTRFFGREQAIARLADLLSPLALSPCRLVTLSGTGGSGKTRLAIEAAGRMGEAFADGVWFAPLADLREAELIAGKVLEALELPRLSDANPLDQVIGFLNGRNAPALLILDNFEHLLEEGACVVRALLEQAPSLSCLVTSRQSLNIEGERIFALDPLPIPRGSESLERLSLVPSTQLFMDRVQAIRPDFQLTEKNANSIAALCTRLEGIPLAIELAAARIQALSPPQMVSQLDQRFAWLVSRRRDATARHRTMWAAIDWSYRLLSPELQRFFARLCVFRGGWTMEAAETACTEPNALDHLEHLVECSLILVGEQEGERRFRMLEMMQEFGRQQMAQSGEEPVVRNRHRDYFLRLAEEAEPMLGRLEIGNWMERLEIEHDNFRAALDWCQADAQEAEAGLRLVGALFKFWDVQGYLREARTRLEAALANSREAPAFERGKVLAHLGWCCLSQFDYVAARRHFEEDLAIRQGLGDRRGEAQALWHMGAVLRDQREFGAARPYFEASLALSRELGFKSCIAGSLQCLGMAAHFQGDFASAFTLYEEALAARRESGDWSAAWVLHILGLLCYDTGGYVTAQRHHAESLAVFIQVGNKKGIAHSLQAFAMLSVAQGRFQRGARLFGAEVALRAPQSIPVNVLDRPRYEDSLAAVRSTLGTEAFAGAWEQGQRLTLEQAVDYALEEA